MDNEFNKDLTPEETPAEEAVEAQEKTVVEDAPEEQAEAPAEEISENQEDAPQESAAKSEEEFASRIEKRFSKYPQPSALSEYAVTKAQKKALAEYTNAYDSYSSAETTKEKRGVILRLNSLLYATDMSLIVVAYEAANQNEIASATLEETEKLKKKGKIASIVFLAVFLLIAVVFTAIKVIPNIESFSDIGSHGFYFVSLALYILLSVYAAGEIKNLFASLGNTKASKVLPALENVPAKLEGVDLAELAEPCVYCGENPQLEGSDYCEDCHSKFLSTKIPFLGWVSGAGILAAGVAAFVVLFFTSAPAFYSLSAEIAASENRWEDALKHYEQMSSTIDEFSSYVSADSFMNSILQVNQDAQINNFIAIAKVYGPIEAVQSASSLLDDTSLLETDERLIPYNNVYNRYYLTATICSSYLESAEEDYEVYLEALSKALDEKGVDKSIIYYTLFGLASNEDKDVSLQLDYLEKTEQAAKENGYDYIWLYGYEYAATLKKVGEFEKALEYYNALIEINRNDLYSHLGKAKCLVSLGKPDEAMAVAEEIKKLEQGENEFSYVIEALVLRSQGKYDAVIELCDTVFEDYQTSPELHHQLSLAYLAKGDYDKAYEHADSADYNGVYWAQYGLTKAYSFEYLNNLFLTANLCVKNGTANAEAAQGTITTLEGYGEKAPEIVNKIVKGEVALEDVLMKGAYDIL